MERDSRRRGKEDDRSSWYKGRPSSSQRTLTIVVETLGAVTAWGGGLYGTEEQLNVEGCQGHPALNT